MLFTFPSRYWFTIGLSDLFSLAGWSRLIHAEFHVFRATQDTAIIVKTYKYAPVTLCGVDFQQLLLRFNNKYRSPTTPMSPKRHWFGLLPVRSPLLRESRLFSFPVTTKMFQFITYASLPLQWYLIFNQVGCPIRKFRGQRLFAPYPDLSQLITSFIASESQGIHRSPFFYFSFIELYVQLLLYSTC